MDESELQTEERSYRQLQVGDVVMESLESPWSSGHNLFRLIQKSYHREWDEMNFEFFQLTGERGRGISSIIPFAMSSLNKKIPVVINIDDFEF